MFLLFVALLLTTNVLEPNLRIAIAADPCDSRTERPTLTYTLLDEFKDDATMILPGGWQKMTCDSVKVHFLRVMDEKNVSGSRNDSDRTTVTVPVDSSPIPQSFVCKCNKKKIALTGSFDVQWNYIVCSREQYKNSRSECHLDKVCLVKNSTTPGRCQNLIEKDCNMGREKRTPDMEYTTVCLGNSTDTPTGECEAGAKAGANDGWPMVETTKMDCTNEELRNFWEGNFSLRHNIAVKDSLIFRPRNRKTTLLVCENGIMTCHRKCIGDPEPKNVTGSCSTGWTVTTDMTEKCNKTKFYCIYQQRQPDQKFRWQFYLYSANVHVTFNGTKAQCEWPGWTGLGKTNPETEKRTCQREFNFPYPVNPEARKLVVGDNTSIIDIPTMTTQTTTTPTATETTKQSTTTTTTTTTDIPDIANIASITDIPTMTTETTTTPTTTKTTEPTTTTTTTTRIPDISNIASITLNTTTNVSQQMPPRNKSWSSKQDVFILIVGQFLLFLLPSFMLYKEGSPYIKE